MSIAFILFLGAVATSVPPAKITSASQQAGNIEASAAVTLDPVEKDYQKLLEDDDTAHEEVDKWIRENEEFRAKGAGTPNDELNRRILARFEPVRKAYEDFLQRHPKHTRARVAYASFLNDNGEEDAAREQYEKALELDPKDPAIYNNLAEIYAHSGPTKKAFEFFIKAIELNPNEPLYYHNFGTVVYLFRKDAKEFYDITEQEVFDKALALYGKAMKLDPTNFPLASDVAQTYYGIQPRRNDAALGAWTNALSLAHDDIEREGVYIHLARIKVQAGRFNEARAHLDAVSNPMYDDLKRRVMRTLNDREKEKNQTNAPPARAVE